MTTLSEKFDALETQLATIEAAADADRNVTNIKLQAIADMLDIINTNAAQNTKYLLAALSQSAACFPCPTPSITVPPIGTTPSVVNSDHCKRAQAFVKTMHDIFTAMDTLQSFNVIGTFNVLNDAISEVISGIAAGDTVPLPSFPETTNIVGDFVSYAGERLFSGTSLMEQFGPLESSLIAALYASTTPEDAKTAYDGVISASSATNGAQLLFIASAYNALYSYYFDPSTLPDLTGYDGTLCGGGGCIEFDSVNVLLGGSDNYQCLVWVDPFTGTDHTPGGYTGSDNVWCLTDLTGYTVNVLSGSVLIREGYTTSPITKSTGESWTFATSDGSSIISTSAAVPFTVEICAP